MIIALESPNQPDVRQLIEDLDAYQVPLYPAESHHGVDISVLEQPKVLFAVARSDDGAAVACGAIVLEAEYGELKRMYTRPEQRGQGIARRLLDFLEAQAQQRGCRTFALETGYLQTDAIKLTSAAAICCAVHSVTTSKIRTAFSCAKRYYRLPCKKFRCCVTTLL
jgi:putative acetyltransferase